MVARCQGHSSFVSSVAFDDLRCDGRTYRFGSVGEDNKIILVSNDLLSVRNIMTDIEQWDFSSGALHRPKLQSTHHQRVSMSSTISLAFRRDRSALYLPSINSPGVDDNPLPRYHPAPSRNEIAVVQPVLVRLHDCSFFRYLTRFQQIKHMEGDLLISIAFLPRCILTSTKVGHLKLWVRPLALRPRHLKNNRGVPDIDLVS